MSTRDDLPPGTRTVEIVMADNHGIPARRCAAVRDEGIALSSAALTAPVTDVGRDRYLGVF